MRFFRVSLAGLFVCVSLLGVSASGVSENAPPEISVTAPVPLLAPAYTLPLSPFSASVVSIPASATATTALGPSALSAAAITPAAMSIDGSIAAVSGLPPRPRSRSDLWLMVLVAITLVGHQMRRKHRFLRPHPFGM